MTSADLKIESVGDDLSVIQSKMGVEKKTDLSLTDFITVSSKYAPMDTGLMPPGVRCIARAGAHTQVVLEVPPGINPIFWGETEGQRDKPMYYLAQPWQYYIADIVKGSLLGARMFYSPNQAATLQTPLYHVNLPNINCFAAGSLVLTKRGNIPIEDVVVGDEVFTHKNRWRPVKKLWYNGVQDVVDVKGQGAPVIRCTPNHSFWAATRNSRAWDPELKKQVFTWNDPDWVAAEDLKEKQAFWGSPLNFSGIEHEDLLIDPVIQLDYREEPVDMDKEEFWFLVGAYLADGCSSTNMSVLVVNHAKVERLVSVAKELEIPAAVMETESEYAMRINLYRASLGRWLSSNFGTHANNKKMPSFVLTLPFKWRKAIVDGYLHGDGHVPLDNIKYTKEYRVKASSVSKNLTVSMKLLAQSIGLRVTMSVQTEGGTTVIEGRTVNTKKAIESVYSSSTYEYLENDVSYTPVRKVTPAGREETYNLLVDEDNSYMVDGVIVKNCKGYSGNGVGWVCFSEQTLVTTMRGQVSIADVVVGDEVLTHRGRWRPVTNVRCHGVKKTVEVRGQGSPKMTVTPDHQFFLSDAEKSEPAWLPIGENQDKWWASIDDFSNMEEIDVPEILYPNNRFKKVDISLSPESFWFIVGSYAANGFIDESRKGFCISIANDKVGPVLDALADLNIEPVVDTPTDALTRITVCRSVWATWLGAHIGRGAASKEFPSFTFTMPFSYREQLLWGYLHGDGCDKRPTSGTPFRVTCGSISRKLAVSGKILAHSIGLRTTWGERPAGTTVIEGRTVQTSHFYEVVYQSYIRDEHCRDGLTFSPIREITPSLDQTVYDIEVEEDHSFLADGIVVHNCLYRTEDWKNYSLSDMIKRILERCSGSEPYNNANMGGTHGPLIYAEHKRPTFMYKPDEWEKKSSDEGFEWICNPNLLVPILVKDIDDQAAHDPKGKPLTLEWAMTGKYNSYYGDSYHPKPVVAFRRKLAHHAKDYLTEEIIVPTVNKLVSMRRTRKPSS